MQSRIASPRTAVCGIALRALRRMASFGFLSSILVSLPAFSAPIPLDSGNWLGPAGARYWRITSPGSYYLNVPEATFITSHEFAVRIEVGNVTFDGMGKGISGSAPPPDTAPGRPNLYGVRVNGGLDIANVRVTNLRVSNKYFGVIFEAVGYGQVDRVTAFANIHGLYFWRTHYTSFLSNVASNNLTSGILCDGNVTTNTYNTLADNVTDGNGHSGIWLWDNCTNNAVVANRSRENTQMGISLSVAANANSITYNVLQGNSTGIWIESNANSISSNVVEYNSNVGILLKQASSNTLSSNTILRNQNAGIWLDQAAGNAIQKNAVALNVNWGIFHANGSAGQSVIDNYFSNVNNAGFSASGSNSWNAALTAGTSSIGGPNLGGNYWATPSRSGFSETASDADHNGIADTSYALGIGNVDLLPLYGKARVRPSFSFGADNLSDLLWRNSATGQNAIWFMNGVAATGEFLGFVESGWSMVGRDSFDGDGKADILWRHTDGRNAIWFMDGVSVKPSSGYIPAVVDANWTVAGVGDFDGDGFSDILWRHVTTGESAVWFMRGLVVKRTTLLPAVNASWLIAGVADFDGDGKSEILWRNSATGENAMWWFESYGTFPGVMIASVSPTWTIAGVGDFNGDGKADILWRNAAGQNAIWFQDGAATSSSALMPSTTTDWTVGSIADFNGDGKSDIVWRKADGTTAIWLMNGASVVASSFAASTPGWTLVK